MTGDLIGWTDDSAALLLRGAGTLVRSDGAPLPDLSSAMAIGPGARWATIGDGGDLSVHAPDGHVLAHQAVDPFAFELQAAWAADRVAILVRRDLWVFDLNTGAVLVHRDDIDDLSPQAFAPDATALVVGSGTRVLRIDVPSGAATTLKTSAHDLPSAAWSSNGRIAISSKSGIGVMGMPGLRFHNDALETALWSGDGSTLRYVIAASQACGAGSEGVGLFVPGGSHRVLVADGVENSLWAPAGTRLAVDATTITPEKRGKRHPWPKSVPHDYAMFSARGNAAMRRIVLLAARSLKRGASRETTVERVRTAYGKVRFKEAGDTAVREAVADQIDRWLHAAGYERIEALDEITC